MQRTGNQEHKPTLADKLQSSSIHLEFFELLHEVTLSNSNELLGILEQAAQALSKCGNVDDAISLQATIGKLFVHLGRHEQFIENRYMHFSDKTECLETELRKSLKNQA